MYLVLSVIRGVSSVLCGRIFPLVPCSLLVRDLFLIKTTIFGGVLIDSSLLPAGCLISIKMLIHLMQIKVPRTEASNYKCHLHSNLQVYNQSIYLSV